MTEPALLHSIRHCAQTPPQTVIAHRTFLAICLYAGSSLSDAVFQHIRIGLLDGLDFGALGVQIG
jgi:hypothetical protein